MSDAENTKSGPALSDSEVTALTLTQAHTHTHTPHQLR